MEQSAQHHPLWDAFKEGNKSAFSAIYQKYGGALTNYGLRILPDTALIEDSIQDLFVDLWNRRQHLSRTSSVKLYLFKALRHRILKNKRVSHSAEMEPLDHHTSLFKESSYEENCIKGQMHSEQIRNLHESLSKLPVRQREAINLRYFHQFSNEEIAAIMEITYPSACKLIYAGLKTLTATLKLAVMQLIFVCSFVA
jgi:RNA polymerase sigma factor (sigma-70 family)